jgi:hypothetical protein
VYRFSSSQQLSNNPGCLYEDFHIYLFGTCSDMGQFAVAKTNGPMYLIGRATQLEAALCCHCFEI